MKKILWMLTLCCPTLLFAATVSLNAVDNKVVEEGSEASEVVTLEVALDAPAENAVSVDVATADGQAVAGKDYEALSRTLRIPKGQTSTLFQVYTVADREDEEYLEQFDVKIVSASGASVGKGHEIITIKDDDEVFEIEEFVQTVEGNNGDVTAVQIKISRKYDSSDTALVGVSTVAGGSATEGEDYVAQYTTIGFQPGELEKFATVEVLGDNKIEEHETAYVEIFSNDDNVVIGNEKAELYIVDDEGELVFSYDLHLNINNNGTLDVNMKGEIPLVKTTDADGNTVYQGEPQMMSFSNVWSHYGPLTTQPFAVDAKLYAKNNEFNSANMVVEWNVGMGATPQCVYPTGDGNNTGFINCIFWRSFKHVHRQKGIWKAPSVVMLKGFEGAKGRSGDAFLTAKKIQKLNLSVYTQEAVFKILRKKAN